MRCGYPRKCDALKRCEDFRLLLSFSSELYIAHPHTRGRVARAAFYCPRNLLPKLYLTRVYRINTARVSAALAEAHAGCLCCVAMRLHVSIHRYLCVYSILSTDQKERENKRTHKLPVHSSGLSINAPIFTANIIEAAAATACAELLPYPRGEWQKGTGVADPAAYAQIVGS